MSKPGRPATGQIKPMAFKPPPPLRAQFEELARASDRSYTDCLIEAMHDWVVKKERAAAQPDARGQP